MNAGRVNKILALCGIMLWWSSFSLHAQTTVVKGVVRDAVSMKPLQFVSVYFKGAKGVTTNEDGSYSLETRNPKLTVVEFSYVGYTKASKAVQPGKEQTVDIDLQPAAALQEVVVTTTKRAKYRNKDNPAVELIRKVIDNKDKNKVTAYDYVQFQQYEKMEFSLSNKPEKLMNNWLLKKYKFVLENLDTTTIEGKALLPVYLEEKISQRYFRKSPYREKTYILGDKKVNFGEFVDNQGVSSYLNRMYEDIDVYQNNISVLSNQFLSPIADLSPTFYRFYIRDTVEEDGIKLVKLYFTPRNANDLLFRGTMFITLDGNYAVQKINMTISKNANLNWTRELRINQDFEKGSDGRYHVVKSNMLAEFALSKGASGGILGERTVSYKNYIINQQAVDSIYTGPAEVTVPQTKNIDSFWVASRHTPLSTIESKVYTNMDSLQNMPSFKRFMDIATLLLAGYKSFGVYEVGPVNTFYSFNPVEGFRLRAGGRSTAKLSKNIYFENYIAYGFKDQKWKGFLSGTYSFNHKSIYSYPLNYFRASYQYDTKIPGQELQFVQEDNFLLSFKRGDNEKWLYNNIIKAEYIREFGKNVSYTFGFKNWKQTPAGSLIFQKAEPANTFVQDITTTELSAEIRWAPHEQFYQGKNYRIPIFNKYPIFKVRYIAGIKGFMNGEYSYHNINVDFYKRSYLSQFGYVDVTLEGGYIFGKVPFPLLTIHRANQTYAYQLNSYNLMNFLEFVSDHYAAFNVDYYMNGFLFNKIPLLKKLKLREVASAKVLYGGVRSENDPAVNTSTLKFPVDAAGNPTTFTLSKQPYVEVSAGIANIFKLLRVDVVKRLTYLDHPEIAKWGIRTRVKFDF